MCCELHSHVSQMRHWDTEENEFLSWECSHSRILRGLMNFVLRWSLVGTKPVCNLPSCLMAMCHWPLEDQVRGWMA
jgi:hypothetical protein